MPKVSEKSTFSTLSRFLVNDIIATVEYNRVNETYYSDGNVANVTNLSTLNTFAIRGNELLATYVSCSAFTTEKNVTATELAEAFTTVGFYPFTVEFLPLGGKYRVLRGKYVKHEALFGRSLVHDFDVSSGSPLRLVDHRTLNSLVVNNVKYVLKNT